MKGYRTVAFNVIMVVIAVITVLGGDVEDMPGEEEINAGLDVVEAAIVFVWGLGNIVLRAITNSPIFKKE